MHRESAGIAAATVAAAVGIIAAWGEATAPQQMATGPILQCGSGL